MKRSLVFWLWNDVLEAEKLCQQIRDFKAHGVEGFFIHPMPSEFRGDSFPGGMPGYLSEHYFEMVQAAVRCAAELDMAAWLYDEGGWPSGILNGYFRDHRKDLLHRQILADGTVKVNSDYPDLLDPEVTRIFIAETHEKYRKYVGEYFGSVIPGIFTDEPYFGKIDSRSAPFSPVLEEVFRREKGYEAREAAMLMLNEHDEKATLDYFEIWQKLIRESFLLPIRQWCHENNLLSIGHFNGDDNVSNVVRLLGGDPAAIHDCLDIPGCDVIWRQIHPLVPESDFPRMTVSAAGNKPVISESFAVYGADLSLAEMKQISAMQFVAGVNMIAPMAVHYSSAGGRQITTMANLYGADYRWQNYRDYADFTRRMSKLFDRTTPVIKAEVPFPVDALRLGKADPEAIFPAGLALAEKQITYKYSAAAESIPENITPDLQLQGSCPQLRTRHLRSPRGERWLLVNGGLDAVTVKFTAPAGYNAWYDPDTGKHCRACADAEGFLTLELPFAGVAVLLNIPGKKAPVQLPKTENGRLPLDFRLVRAVSRLKAAPDGLTEAAPAPEPDQYFSGILRYEAEVDLPQPVRAELELPCAIRAMCAVETGGVKIARNWAPYRWELSLPAGKSSVAVEISTTAFAAMQEPGHLRFLEENSFNNVYMGYCNRFEMLFPGEEPLKDAFIRW